MQTIDEYSVASLPLEMLCRGNGLSRGTGFFCIHGGIHFLVSNWHVFSGRHPSTGQPLSKATGGTPDQIRLPLHLAGQLGQASLVGPVDICGPNGDPLWLQHQRGQDVDVAVLRVDPFPLTFVAYALPRPNEAADMQISVGTDVFVIGFPLGMTYQGILPIWKRASVATEPDIPYGNLPMFLVDTATREGMSGSPVVARAGQSYRTTNGNISMGGPYSRTLGIYSGRYVGDDELAAQLGRVWTWAILEELLNNPAKGGYQLRKP